MAPTLRRALRCEHAPASTESTSHSRSVPVAPARFRPAALAAAILAAVGLLVGSWGNAPAAGFGPKTDFATGISPFSLAIGDLNGDGKPDLATANYTSSTVSVLLGTGGGSFGPKTDFATGSGPRSVA